MKRYIYYMAILAMMLFACNREKETKDIQSEDQTITDQDKATGKQEEQLTAADTTGSPAANNVPGLTKNGNADWDRKIIKTADVQLQVKDYKIFNTSVHNSLKQYGAYIARGKSAGNRLQD